MTDPQDHQSTFITSLQAAIADNMGDENFGVSELADKINMSRSNLLRRVKQETGLSVSLLIRQVRLEHARELLLEDSLTVSEISFKVGFGSTSYFTKCFKEHYGYTPGEVKHQTSNSDGLEQALPESRSSHSSLIIALMVVILIIAATAIWFLGSNGATEPSDRSPKSIAVLPFKNDSADSSNVYFMNGLMEAILDNFQKVEELRVTSRTTVERYRHLDKTIPELAEELGVSYIVEGSGQKINNEILLTIQLIKAPEDRHIWSRQYKRNLDDVFQLQADIAKSIAAEVGVLITPEENSRIDKIPTQNLVAYDYYLKGLDLLKQQREGILQEAIEHFKKAIQQDGQFAQAYGYIAVCYYYLDLFQAEKQHTEDLKNYADKAMELDAVVGESLIARGLYYMHIEEYQQAVASFEQVLAYYPSSGWTHNFLTDIYTNYLPDTDKYLEHALQGIQLAVAGQDSVTASYTYLHLSNALSQNGFIEEAEEYIHKSLAYNPENLFSDYLAVYIRLAQDNNWEQAKNGLAGILRKDSTRLDVLQELAKVCYTMRDYEEAWNYYERFVRNKQALNLDIYQGEDIKIAFVLDQLGRDDQAKQYLQAYLDYAQHDQSDYKELSLSAYYATIDDINEAMRHFKLFAESGSYRYWLILSMDKDPILLKMADHPDFIPTIEKIRDRFWKEHDQIRQRLEAENVI